MMSLDKIHLINTKNSPSIIKQNLYIETYMAPATKKYEEKIHHTNI